MSLDIASKTARLRGLTAKFDQAVATAQPMYPRYCTMVTSQGSDEQYAMIGAMPGMREWLGERQFKELAAADYTLKNKEWESSLAVEKNHIDDDRLGMYGPLLQNLGAEAAFHPDELLFDIIELGASSACFDGQYFFDTDHAWGESGTQSNKLTHTVADLDAITEAEFRAAYHKMRAAMLGF